MRRGRGGRLSLPYLSYRPTQPSMRITTLRTSVMLVIGRDQDLLQLQIMNQAKIVKYSDDDVDEEEEVSVSGRRRRATQVEKAPAVSVTHSHSVPTQCHSVPTYIVTHSHPVSHSVPTQCHSVSTRCVDIPTQCVRQSQPVSLDSHSVCVTHSHSVLISIIVRMLLMVLVF